MFLLIVIVNFIIARIPTEGCRGLGQPQILYYENYFINESYSSLPSWSISQMKQLYSQILEQFDSDYCGKETDYGPWLFYGASGRALLHLRLLNENKTYHLEMANLYIKEAISLLPSSEDHFGYLKGNVGVFAVAAMVSSLKGDIDSVDYYLDLVKSVFGNVTNEDCADYDEGIAGLIDIAPILNNFFGKEVISKELELRVGHLIFENGLKYYNKTTKALQFKNWLGESTVWWIGVGVGSGGSIYELLKRKELMGNDTIRRYVLSTLEYFLSQQDEDGFMRSDYPDRVQWCHGSPGFIAVFLEAYEVFKDQRFLKAAKLAGEYTVRRGILQKGFQLGHGVGGNIYLVFFLYKYTKDPYWMSKALSMLLVSLKTPFLTDPDNWISYDCVPGSIWITTQGGMLTLFYDLLNCANDLSEVSMPIFETSRI